MQPCRSFVEIWTCLTLLNLLILLTLHSLYLSNAFQWLWFMCAWCHAMPHDAALLRMAGFLSDPSLGPVLLSTVWSHSSSESDVRMREWCGRHMKTHHCVGRESNHFDLLCFCTRLLLQLVWEVRICNVVNLCSFWTDPWMLIHSHSMSQ